MENINNRVASAFREIARGIAKTNHLCANVDEIVFIIDETRDREAVSASDILRIPEIWQELIVQLTGDNFRFAIRLFNVNLEKMNANGNYVAALIYHELRHIKKNSKSGEPYLDMTHDIEDWHELIPFGDWERDIECAALLPNLLEAKCGEQI